VLSSESFSRHVVAHVPYLLANMWFNLQRLLESQVVVSLGCVVMVCTICGGEKKFLKLRMNRYLLIVFFIFFLLLMINGLMAQIHLRNITS
jgi:hypothetical protein